MIEKIRGQYIASSPRGIIVDVGGVGYGLEIPLSTHTSLPEPGEDVDLWVHTYVREDAIKLFGFRHYVDRIAFEILISLNGVGPKVALAILSTLTVEQLKKAIMLERQDILQNVPGIGKRLAEKIFVELKPKLKKLNAAGASPQGRAVEGAALIDDGLGLSDEANSDPNWAVVEDVKSALENLGFKDKAVTEALNKLTSGKDEMSFQELMREALGVLGAHKIETGGRNNTLEKLF
jgi:Holliday junction DNA helicase RuvA